MTWRDEVRAARDAGYDVLDWLSACEDEGEVSVVACLIRSDDPGDMILLRTSGEFESVADLYASAAWHERETAEMFGITFAGSADPRPLLLPAGAQPPLRKQTPLPARLNTWPGAVDPAKPRRTQTPPGTPWT